MQDLAGRTSITSESAEMRVAIARDVLMQLGREDVPLEPVLGAYIEGIVPERFMLRGDLRDLADDLQSHCCVCALGALVLSKARLYDETPADDVLSLDGLRIGAGQTGIVDALRGIFDEAQLDLVELSFESHPGFIDEDRNVETAMRFGERFPDSRRRLAAIMHNIVDHGGTFEPGDAAWLDGYLARA